MRSLSAVENAHDDGIWAVAWASTGQIVTGSCDETVRTFVPDADASRPPARQHTLSGHVLGVTSVAVSAEAGIAASSALDSQIRVWNLDTGAEVCAIDPGPVEAWTIALDASGKLLASGSQAGHVNLWSPTSGEQLGQLPTGGGKFVMSVACSADGRHIACGVIDTGFIYLFDAESRQLLHCFHGHSSTVRSLCFSADGKLLLTGSDDAHANMYEVGSGQQVATLEGHTSWVLGVAFSPDVSVLASCSADRSVRLWDVRMRESLHTIANAHTEQAWGVAFDPSNGSRLVSVGDDRTVRLYGRSGVPEAAPGKDE